jgi:hypothetical protein
MKKHRFWVWGVLSILLAISAASFWRANGPLIPTEKNDSPLTDADSNAVVPHKVLESGLHQYTLSGLYLRWADRKAGKYNPHLEYFQGLFHEVVNIEVDEKNDVMTIVTSRKVADVRNMVNQFAKIDGKSPYWEELVARKSRSASFLAGLYRLVYVNDVSLSNAYGECCEWQILEKTNGCLRFRVFTGNVLSDHKTESADFTLQCKCGQYALKGDGEMITRDLPQYEGWPPPPIPDLHFAKDETGTVKFNRSTAFCEVESRFAMRLFDKDDQCIWEDQDNIYCVFRAIAHDIDGDGRDEIIVLRNDHGRSAILVFSTASTTPKLPPDIQGQKKRGLH